MATDFRLPRRRLRVLILVSDPAMPIRDQGALAADGHSRNIGVPSVIYTRNSASGLRVRSPREIFSTPPSIRAPITARSPSLS